MLTLMQNLPGLF